LLKLLEPSMYDVPGSTYYKTCRKSQGLKRGAARSIKLGPMLRAHQTTRTSGKRDAKAPNSRNNRSNGSLVHLVARAWERSSALGHFSLYMAPRKVHCSNSVSFTGDR
jgi:hypothetical protein